MSTDTLKQKLRTLAAPFASDDSKNPEQALLDLIDETVLQRRLCVAFGAGGFVSAEFLVRSRRLVRIEALRGLDLPEEQAALLSKGLSTADEATLARLGDLLRSCIQKGGQPYLMGAESAASHHDILSKGISTAQLATALQPESVDVVA